MNIFEQATRQKLRFDTSKGLVTAEDLWDLPLTGKGPNLDDIAKYLFKQLKEADGEVSFVKPAVKTTADLQVKFDVVKHIIDIKVADRDAATEARVKSEKKQQIMALIDQKKNEALASSSVDDLQKMLDAL